MSSNRNTNINQENVDTKPEGNHAHKRQKRSPLTPSDFVQVREILGIEQPQTVSQAKIVADNKGSNTTTVLLDTFKPRTKDVERSHKVSGNGDGKEVNLDEMKQTTEPIKTDIPKRAAKIDFKKVRAVFDEMSTPRLFVDLKRKRIPGSPEEPSILRLSQQRIHTKPGTVGQDVENTTSEKNNQSEGCNFTFKL